MKAGLRTFLLNDSSIAAAVTGVFSFPAPQGRAFPYVTLSKPLGLEEFMAAASLKVYDETWQVDVIAATNKEAVAIMELIQTRMESANRTTMGNYFVWSVTLSSVMDTSTLEDFGNEASVQRVTLEYRIKRDREVST